MFSRQGQTVYSPGTGYSNSNIEQKGNVSLSAGTQSYAITFSPAFSKAPTSFIAQVQMPGSSGEIFAVSPDLSTLTANGVTVWLSGVPTAASAGGVINWRAEL